MLEVKEYLDKTVNELHADALAKGLKIPDLTVVDTPNGGQIWAAGYFWYLVFGRGPGKQPPPDAMLKYVQDNPDALAKAKQIFKGVTERSLAYLIGRKIGQKGTDIYTGKRPGLDFLGAMEKNFPELTQKLAKNEAIKVLTFLKSGLIVLLFLSSCGVFRIERSLVDCPPDTVVIDYGYYKEAILIPRPCQQ